MPEVVRQVASRLSMCHEGQGPSAASCGSEDFLRELGPPHRLAAQVDLMCTGVWAIEDRVGDHHFAQGSRAIAVRAQP